MRKRATNKTAEEIAAALCPVAIRILRRGTAWDGVWVYGGTEGITLMRLRELGLLAPGVGGDYPREYATALGRTVLALTPTHGNETK